MMVHYAAFSTERDDENTAWTDSVTDFVAINLMSLQPRDNNPELLEMAIIFLRGCTRGIN